MAISFSSPASKDARARGAGVTAVLGPTNTGKTHLAIERMLAHSSGMIGLPLRLLAREVYNKVAERVGPDSVALITGEEKIKPANPRFWVSTVEAMPRDLDVAFLAVDEIQLGADLERGHVFTDRMLNRRGREETLVLGAATMQPIVQRLLPGAHILTRPRLSQLTFAGDKKITRLPRRSAIVAFSAAEVYEIAELIRRQRGGAAVVLGALSPRTRNAQVALYQSGDVEYLIATDAIGMGLNLDVDHVAFASDRKFDGYQFRKLNPAELAQIAGRAGRANRDGTFGTTGRCPPFEDPVVQQLESHSFEPVKLLQWRNTDLDFASIGALQASLAATPTEQGLTRAPIGEDIVVLEHAARDDEVRAMAKGRVAIERLWEVCQVPDYRKIAPATHAELAVTLYGFLMRDGTIADDWFARQVAQADHTEGDIDALSNRIAHVRTWTFVANRPDWLADPEHWQGVARAVEDKLSDALHERLTARFVDRRTSVLMRRLRENTMLDTEISKTGDVVVEGHRIGRLEGFVFAADAAAGGSDAKALQGAAQKALAGEIDARATRLSQAPADQFVLASDGVVRWLGDAVAKLMPGDEVLRPRLRILADEHLTGAPRDAVQSRLDLWLKTHIERLLAPLFTVAAAEDVTGIARGVAFQMVEALGVLERQKVAEDVKSLDQTARAALRKHGVRFGAYHIYLPALLKPAPRALAAQLWALKHGGLDAKGLPELQHLAASGRTSIPVDKEVDRALYRTVGYRVCGERAVRVDILERLADLIRPALAWRNGAPGERPAGAVEGFGFTVTPSMTSLTGASGEDFASILRSLGYRMDRRPKPPEPAPAAATLEASAAPATETPAAVAAADDSATAPGDAGEAPSLSAEGIMPEPAPALAPDATPPESGTVEPQQLAPTETAEPQETEPQDFMPTSARLPEVAPVTRPDGGPEPAELADAPATGVEAAAEPVEEAPATSVDSSAEPMEEAGPPAIGAEDAAAPMEQAAAPATAPAEEFIEVWRPGRHHEERRPHKGRGQRRSGRPPDQPAAASPDGAPPAAEQADRPDRRDGRPHRHDRKPGRDRDRDRDRNRDRNRDRDREQRAERAGRESRHERQGRDQGRERQPFVSRPAPKERREKQADPNSPFAKLAALKEQLEAKERR
jgi:ATP-dependent RNA helicase SUPV3L1/SUV3